METNIVNNNISNVVVYIINNNIFYFINLRALKPSIYAVFD